jgi:hypothetical protein
MLNPSYHLMPYRDLAYHGDVAHKISCRYFLSGVGAFGMPPPLPTGKHATDQPAESLLFTTSILR